MCFLHDVEHGKSSRAGYWIAAKRAEKFHSVVEGLGDFSGRYCRSERKPISNGFAEHHNVRHHVLCFESPEMRSQPPESDLHFISDADSTRIAHMAICLGKVILRKNNLSADAGKSFCNKCGPASACLQDFANFADMASVLRAD